MDLAFWTSKVAIWCWVIIIEHGPSFLNLKSSHLMLGDHNWTWTQLFDAKKWPFDVRWSTGDYGAGSINKKKSNNSNLFCANCPFPQKRQGHPLIWNSLRRCSAANPLSIHRWRNGWDGVSEIKGCPGSAKHFFGAVYWTRDLCLWCSATND